jgi:hypothetical protein
MDIILYWFDRINRWAFVISIINSYYMPVCADSRRLLASHNAQAGGTASRRFFDLKQQVAIFHPAQPATKGSVDSQSKGGYVPEVIGRTQSTARAEAAAYLSS